MHWAGLSVNRLALKRSRSSSFGVLLHYSQAEGLRGSNQKQFIVSRRGNLGRCRHSRCGCLFLLVGQQERRDDGFEAAPGRAR